MARSERRIMSEQLQSFAEMVKEDKDRAKALFFSETFKKEYLENDTKRQDVYHQLLMGRNREQILEEFLITAELKEVGGQAVLGRQSPRATPWLTERHGYDPT